MKITFSEETKKFAKLQNSGQTKSFEKAEILDMLYDYIKTMNPKNVLDLGSGIGRGTVYIFKKTKWENTHFYLLDSDGGTVKGGVNFNNKKNFYNSMDATKMFCKENGLKKFTTVNIENEKIPNVKFDIVFSVLSIGFHWSIDRYLDILSNKLHKDSLLLFHTRSIYNKKEKIVKWANSEIRKIKKHSLYELIEYKGGETKEADRYLLICKRK